MLKRRLARRFGDSRVELISHQQMRTILAEVVRKGTPDFSAAFLKQQKINVVCHYHQKLYNTSRRMYLLLKGIFSGGQ
jgi:hypothetical protein